MDGWSRSNICVFLVRMSLYQNPQISHLVVTLFWYLFVGFSLTTVGAIFWFRDHDFYIDDFDVSLMFCLLGLFWPIALGLGAVFCVLGGALYLFNKWLEFVPLFVFGFIIQDSVAYIDKCLNLAVKFQVIFKKDEE